jgi:hypothetical protein
MRPVQLADLDLAARALLPVYRLQRVTLAQTICEEARIADKYRKHIGQPHPMFGTGTLMAAAARYEKCPRPDQCNSAYLECLRIVIDQVISARQDHTT